MSDTNNGTTEQVVGALSRYTGEDDRDADPSEDPTVVEAAEPPDHYDENRYDWLFDSDDEIGVGNNAQAQPEVAGQQFRSPVTDSPNKQCHTTRQVIEGGACSRGIPFRPNTDTRGGITEAGVDALASLGIRNARGLRDRVTQFRARGALIQDFLPHQSINMLLGRSGLGKSPVCYQAAIAVASGRPFLDLPTEQGRVLCVDAENGIGQVDRMVAQLSRYMGLEGPPADLHTWNRNDCDGRAFDLAALVKACRPQLVILDPVSALYPEFETENSKTQEVWQNLRRLMSEFHFTLLAVHHLRKPPSDVTPLSLDVCERLDDWLNQARGASSIITGSDNRIGIDEPCRTTGAKHAHADLVIRARERVEGEKGQIFLRRVYDEGAQPFGYERLAGIDLITNEDYRAAFRKLSNPFRFTDAKTALGKADSSTNHMLTLFLTAGVVRKDHALGIYMKTVDDPLPPPPAEKPRSRWK